MRSEEYPWAPSPEERRAAIETSHRFGTKGWLDEKLEGFSPSIAHDEEAKRWWRRWVLASSSLGGLEALLDLEARAGLHTSECEQLDGKVGGIAVHIGTRVAAEARPGEVIVPRTIKDLVAGSDRVVAAAALARSVDLA